LGDLIDGSKVAVFAITVGFEPEKHQDIFFGTCEELGASAAGDLACTAGGKTTLIS
jgi:hypothetical protein